MKKNFYLILFIICLMFISIPVSAYEPFNDVNENHWFYNDVLYCYENNIFNGLEPNTFAPNENMTRAMFVTALYRISKEDGNYNCNFKDVKETDWYYNSVAWAYETNLVNGVGDNLFAPNKNITREQMAVIFYNYIETREIRTDHINYNYNIDFKDAFNISNWAFSKVYYMGYLGLILGDNNGFFNPQNYATRAENAAVFHRFVEKIGTKRTDYEAEILSARIVKDHEGDNALAVHVRWTNNSNKTTTFFLECDDEMYQNGIELEWTYPNYEDDYSLNLYDNQDVQIKPGTSIEVICLKKLYNNYSNIEIEIYDESWNYVWKNTLLTSKIYNPIEEKFLP